LEILDVCKSDKPFKQHIFAENLKNKDVGHYGKNILEGASLK